MKGVGEALEDPTHPMAEFVKYLKEVGVLVDNKESKEKKQETEETFTTFFDYYGGPMNTVSLCTFKKCNNVITIMYYMDIPVKMQDVQTVMFNYLDRIPLPHVVFVDKLVYREKRYLERLTNNGVGITQVEPATATIKKKAWTDLWYALTHGKLAGDLVRDVGQMNHGLYNTMAMLYMYMGGTGLDISITSKFMEDTKGWIQLGPNVKNINFDELKYHVALLSNPSPPSSEHA